MILKINFNLVFIFCLYFVATAQDAKMEFRYQSSVFTYANLSDTTIKKNMKKPDGSVSSFLNWTQQKAYFDLDSAVSASLPDSLYCLTNMLFIDNKYSHPLDYQSIEYDSVTQKLSTIWDNDYSFIAGVDMYSNDFLKTMRYVGKKTLYINGYTYATRHFSNAKPNEPHQELFLSEIGNYPIQVLVYDANAKLMDTLSSVLIKKFNYVTHVGKFHKPSNSEDIKILYSFTLPDSIINLNYMSYKQYEKYSNSYARYSEVDMFLYLAAFVKKKDGIYRKYIDSTNREKLILYYPLSTKKAIRDYQYSTQRSSINNVEQPIFNNYEKLLGTKNPMHNALSVRFIGSDTLLVDSKKRSCYHFEETPIISKSIFSTLGLYYCTIDIWIDKETLLPLKRKIWVKIKEETDRRLYREDTFGSFHRQQFVEAR